jgi:hypothetical protein
MAEALTTLTKLLTVWEIQEDASGAALSFQEGSDARLALSETAYVTYLRLVQRQAKELGCC